MKAFLNSAYLDLIKQQKYAYPCPPDGEPSGYLYKVRYPQGAHLHCTKRSAVQVSQSGLANFSRLRNNSAEIYPRANNNQQGTAL